MRYWGKDESPDMPSFTFTDLLSPGHSVLQESDNDQTRLDIRVSAFEVVKQVSVTAFEVVKEVR